VIAARKDKKITSFPEFLLALTAKQRTSATLTPLVKAGAFDNLDFDRANLLAGLDGMLEAVNLASGDAALLAAVWPSKTTVQQLSASDRDAMTADQLGYFLQGHPVDRYSILREFFPVVDLSALSKQCWVLVVATDVHVITTKKGTKMAFLTVQDESATAEVTVFPQQYLQSGGLTAGTVYLINVSQDRESTPDAPRYLANRVQHADKAVANLPEVLFLNLGNEANVNMKKDVLRVLLSNRGRMRVNVTSDGKSVLLAARYSVSGSADMQATLREMLGENAVSIRKPTIE
jgi:DNA polymerase-3 subunit alpha